jgi:hypothetical protein
VTERSERFRQRSLSRARASGQILSVPSGDLVQTHLESPDDDGRAAAFSMFVERLDQAETGVTTPAAAEVDALLESLHGQFDRQRFDSFMSELRRSTLQSLSGPLGLGYAVSGLQAFDAGRGRARCASFQPGAVGNKTVIVLSAPGADEERLKRPAAGQQKGQTGETLSDLVRRGHDRDPGRFPSPDLADYRICNAWDKVEYEAKTQRSEASTAEVMDPANLARLRADIGAADTILTFGVRANLAVDALDVPAQRMRGAHPSLQSINRKYKPRSSTQLTDKSRKSKKAMQQESAHDRREQFHEEFFDSETGRTPTPPRPAVALGAQAAEVAGRMATQQVIGAALSEFSMAMFDELGDCWSTGLVVGDEGFVVAVTRRADSVRRRVFNKWKSFLEVGAIGMLSGFLAELANILVKTIRNFGARFARIVREGISSFLRALRLVLFPPSGMAPVDVWHEASKLMAAGVITVGGIVLEELVAKALPGFDFITSTVVAVITGFAIAATMYAMDKLDLFGSVAIHRQAFTFRELDIRVEAIMAQSVMLATDADDRVSVVGVELSELT